jgi:hypothetical protein
MPNELPTDSFADRLFLSNRTVWRIVRMIAAFVVPLIVLFAGITLFLAAWDTR